MTHEILRKKIEKLLDIKDPTALETVAKLVEQIAQSRVRDAVDAQLKPLRVCMIAGRWTLNREGDWVRFNAKTGDVVARVYRRPAIREWFCASGGMAPNAEHGKRKEDAFLIEAGWELT